MSPHLPLRQTLPLLLFAFSLLVFSLAAGAQDAPSLDERLQGLLDGEPAASLGASLPVSGVLIPAGAGEVPGRTRFVLQLVVGTERLAGAGEELGISVVATSFDEPPELHSRPVPTGPLAGAGAWVYLLPLETSEESRGVAVLVEAGRGGAGPWGGTLVEVSTEPLDVPAGAAMEEGAPLGVRHRPVEEAAKGGALRLLPPKKQPATGRTRFETLVSITGIDKVEFYLDGELADEDGRGPFTGTVELLDPPRPQTVKAVAYSRDGLTLGEDELEVNGGSGLLRVAITGITGEPAAGSVEVAASVEIPPDATLDRVEMYFNEQLAAQLREPPFRARVPTPTAGPSDYVRVAVFLADGSTIDAVELLAAQGSVDRVEVNLAQLYVVVTDGDGHPVTDLTAGDFEIRVKGESRQPESFQFARDLPLLLGLIIDSSGSMATVMEETKMAAGHFLGQSLRGDDKAFIVDFDTQPRLAHPVSKSLAELTRAFRRMTPEGLTALYDSIVFSMLQFGTEPGRKALVLLTDGDDYRSRFGPDRALRDSRASGVPVYIIGLGDPRYLKKAYKQNNLDDMAEKTGGRVFLAEDPQELFTVYDRINAELRSQYLLTVAADPETDSQDIEVRVRRPGTEVRHVVGAR